jgi:NhaA family Na+:H+ antiporter
MNVPARRQGEARRQAAHSPLVRQVLQPADNIIHNETVAGVALLIAACVALVWANVHHASYAHLWEAEFAVRLGDFQLGTALYPYARDGLTLHHVINDGLMTLFFFVVALEIKREMVFGELSGFRRAVLPVAAALGGMVLPAGLYAALNYHDPGATKGWAIPMATDIAFAVGVFGLVGKRIPAELRMFLLSFAVADDIGGILVIAFYYTTHLYYPALVAVLLILGVLFFCQRIGVVQLNVYLLLGVLLWGAMFRSGVHATIAGVILGALTPAKPWFSRLDYARELQQLVDEYRKALEAGKTERADAYLGEIEELTAQTESPLERRERELHPWVAYVVLPVFALANCGVSLDAGQLQATLSSRVAWGIALGLLLGKLVGTVSFSWLAVQVGVAQLPGNVRWRHFIGTGLLGGIGFTVSLFITPLAFRDAPSRVAEAKVAILAASVFAGLAGYLFLRFCTPKKF